jgi:hypothetical protein
MGPRGTGKTVFLEQLKSLAQADGWLWAGNDLSEQVNLTEHRIAGRMVVDLSTLLSAIRCDGLVADSASLAVDGFLQRKDLSKIYNDTPGAPEDKLKVVFADVRKTFEQTSLKGVIFGFDEAQNLSDHVAAREVPLSMLVDVFSLFQATPSNCRFVLVLSGLPVLLQRLCDTRRYTESMFDVIRLGRLDTGAARAAIEKSVELSKSTTRFSEAAIGEIIEMSDGYPCFIQFICKEVFDAWIGKIPGGEIPYIPRDDILQKLDQDFFAPKWARATNRQQDFMRVIASMPNSDWEFSVQDIVDASRQWLRRGFNPSHATQILQALAEKDFIYKNRRASYCFAIPLLGRFIRRLSWDASTLRELSA